MKASTMIIVLAVKVLQGALLLLLQQMKVATLLEHTGSLKLSRITESCLGFQCYLEVSNQSGDVSPTLAICKSLCGPGTHQSCSDTNMSLLCESGSDIIVLG